MTLDGGVGTGIGIILGGGFSLILSALVQLHFKKVVHTFANHGEDQYDGFGKPHPNDNYSANNMH